MDLETAEIIISRYYRWPCSSEKVEAVISRPPSASPGDSAETDGFSTPEGGYSRQVGPWPNYTLAVPAFAWAAGTMAVPGPCLSHIPHAHTRTTSAVSQFSNLHEVGISVCIPPPLDSCAFSSLSVLTSSLGENWSDVLYFHQRLPLAPRSGGSPPNSNGRPSGRLSEAQVLQTAV